MAANRPSEAGDCVITCIKGEGYLLKFWAIPVSMIAVVRGFEDHLAQISSDLEVLSEFTRCYEIPIGVKCVVKSKFLSNLWCRAHVLRYQDYCCVVVKLLDYGHEEVVEAGDVRNIDDPILSEPAQALEYILADVVPARRSDWSIEAIKFCEKHLLFQNLSCSVVSHFMEIPVVRIAKKGEDEAFVQRLLNSGLALINREIVFPPLLPTSYEMNNMDPNSAHLVRISCIKNAHKFYVQLSAAVMELKNLMDAINSLPKETLPPLKVPAVNTPCLAQLSAKACYYRALITYIEQNHCKVFFVDYGFSELKEIHELRAINPAFLKLAAQAICCSFPTDVDINPEKLHPFIGYEHLQLHVLSQTPEAYIVKLFCQGRDLSLPPPAPQSYFQQKLETACTLEVNVCHVNSATEFYFQLSSLKEQLHMIYDILNDGYDLIQIALAECTPGKPVCVKFSQDNAWHRASVVKVNNDDDIEVFFVDYGNYDNVPLSDIRKIGPELLKFPFQAFKGYLFEVNLPTDSKLLDDAFGMLEELTVVQVLMAQINAFSGDSGYGVTLHPKNSPSSVNEKVLSLVRASVPTIPVSDLEDLYVTSFLSSNSFFAQFKKLDSDKLENMQKEINLFYFGIQNTTYMPKEGQLVCARFNVDDQYYRAKVESCQDGFCNVYFIDYGNREFIPVKDVHSMDSSFFKYPQFGIECALLNCPSHVSNDKLSSVMLEKSIKVKMVRKENGKWFVTVKENCPENNAILEAFRQPETPAHWSKLGAGLGSCRERSSKNTGTHQSMTNNGDKTVILNDNKNSIKSYNIEVPDVSSQIKKELSRLQLSTKTTKEKYGGAFNKEFVNMGSGRLQDSKKTLVLNSHAAFTNLKFSSIIVQIGKSEAVVVTYGLNPGEIFCQLKSCAADFKDMMAKFQSYYNKITDAECLIDRPHPGMICAAQFHLDSAWYRAEIKKVEGNKIYVFYVDYGNNEIVDRKKIRSIAHEFTKLPVQAIKCRIRGIRPPGRTWTVIANLSKYFEGNAVCKFVSKENDYFVVDMSCNQKDVAQLLVSDRFAQSDSVLQNEKSSFKKNNVEQSRRNKFPETSALISDNFAVSYPIIAQNKERSIKKNDVEQSRIDTVDFAETSALILDKFSKSVSFVVQNRERRPFKKDDVEQSSMNKVAIPEASAVISDKIRKSVSFVDQNKKSSFKKDNVEQSRMNKVCIPEASAVISDKIRKSVSFVDQNKNSSFKKDNVEQSRMNKVCIPEASAVISDKIRKSVSFVDQNKKSSFKKDNVEQSRMNKVCIPKASALISDKIRKSVSFVDQNKNSSFKKDNVEQSRMNKVCIPEASALISDKIRKSVSFVDQNKKSSFKKDNVEQSRMNKVCIPEISTQFLNQAVCLIPSRKDNFMRGQLVSVAVSFIENPSKFWCQLLDESQVLDQLMKDIDTQIAECSPISEASLKTGLYCLAQYWVDKAWYRAQIKSCEPDNKCRVFFIDCGHYETVSQSQMKSLLPKMMEHPPQCFECCLLNTPSNLVPEMTTLFRDTIQKKTIEITAKIESVKLGVTTVTLLFHKDDQEINVNELLFGVKEQTSEIGIQKDAPHFLSPDVPLGLHDGYTSSVNTPQDFYIQLSGIEKPLQNLSQELADLSKNASGIDAADLSVGYACLSQYSEDNKWYRAEVIAIKDLTVDVLFVDYGNVDTVDIGKLKSLDEKHLQMRPLAIKCKMNGIVPAADEWSEEAINTFQGMVLEECLGISFISKDIPATVNIIKNDKEISQCLVDAELANVAETDVALNERSSEEISTGAINLEKASNTEKVKNANVVKGIDDRENVDNYGQVIVSDRRDTQEEENSIVKEDQERKNNDAANNVENNESYQIEAINNDHQDTENVWDEYLGGVPAKISKYFTTFKSQFLKTISASDAENMSTSTL